MLFRSIPDHMRTMPLPVFYQLFYELVCEKAARLDFLIALGTHQPMSEDAIAKVLGVTVDELHGKYARMRVLNHEWASPETFVEIGTIAKEELIPLTHGTIDRDVKIEVNRLAMEYDRVIVLGPVFPHEVMGYSGGTKYFFPGISGADLTNATHWVAAMQTCFATIGKPDTPQRRLIERAVERIPTERVYLCTVNRKEGVYGFFGGAPFSSWRAAVELSKQVNGPTRGRLLRPGDNKEPQSFAFVQCAGSRDENHLQHCSYVCCIATFKQISYIRAQYPEAKIYVFYIDLRTPGKYEQFRAKFMEDPNTIFIKGKVASTVEA